MVRALLNNLICNLKQSIQCIGSNYHVLNT